MHEEKPIKAIVKTAPDAMQEDNGSDADQNYQFYKEYCRLYYANIILTNRLQ
jgi:hypothetical protein